MFNQDKWNTIAAEVGIAPCNADVFATIMPHFDAVQLLFYNDFDGYVMACEEIAVKASTYHELVQLYYMVALGDSYLYNANNTVPLSIRKATFRDIAIWVDNYYHKSGRLGLGEYRWLRHHLQGKLFRLGRLQFECPDQSWRDGWPTIDSGVSVPSDDAFVLHVHIPQGERLDYDDCKASYRLAIQFFRQYFGKQPVAFACDSWLLHPYLRQILAQDSNIIRFQSDYTICCSDNDDRQTLERVFGIAWERGMPYPQSTSLQKVVSAYIEGNGKVGNGYGIRTV